MDGRIWRDLGGDTEVAGHADHALSTELHADLDRDDVARQRDAAANGHRPVELQVVVLWRPWGAGDLLDGDRRVVDDVRRRLAVVDRVGVDQRLEGRARLAQGLRRAVELRVIKVAPADERPDRAGARVDRDERALQVRRCRGAGILAIRTAGDVLLVALVLELAELPALDRLELPLERALGGRLHVDVNRGVDLEPLFVELLAEVLIELVAHPFDEIRRDLAGLGAAGELERVGAGE